jgi:hypothetical protein
VAPTAAISILGFVGREEPYRAKQLFFFLIHVVVVAR